MRLSFFLMLLEWAFYYCRRYVLHTCVIFRFGQSGAAASILCNEFSTYAFRVRRWVCG